MQEGVAVSEGAVCRVPVPGSISPIFFLVVVVVVVVWCGGCRRATASPRSAPTPEVSTLLGEVPSGCVTSSTSTYGSIRLTSLASV